ncbi:MAG: hypothetical protein U0R68_13555 [Candidatus Nanopelagicales bacterium]
MTTTLERPTSRGTGTALLIAGPVVAVAAFLAALAGLNWYDSGHPLSSNLLTQTVALLLLVVLPVLLGGALVWRGLAAMGVGRRAWRLVLALVVVLGGAAIIAVLLWLAGLNLQQGSASAG